MAKTPKPTPAIADINDAAEYTVKLNRVVDRGNGVFLKPGQEVTVSGKVLRELGDAVDVAEPRE